MNAPTGSGALECEPGRSGPIVLLPAKGFDIAKSRLGDVLDSDERRRLARATFERVAAAVLDSSRCAKLCVVSSDDAVRARALELGARLLDDCGGSFGELIAESTQALFAEDAPAALVLMGDLPALCASDLDLVVDAGCGGVPVIAPDRMNAGTNALLVTSSTATMTRFGRADSYDAHLRAFAADDITPAVINTPGLAWDLDTANDYRLLSAAACGASPVDVDARSLRRALRKLSKS